MATCLFDFRLGTLMNWKRIENTKQIRVEIQNIAVQWGKKSLKRDANKMNAIFLINHMSRLGKSIKWNEVSLRKETLQTNSLYL